MRSKLIIFILLLSGLLKAQQPAVKDTFTFAATDTAMIDSSAIVMAQSKAFTLIDSLRNDTVLRSLLHPYEQIKYAYLKTRSQVRINLPTVKEVEARHNRHAGWQFWIICFILFYISFVRISNQNNFRVFILSVFNLKLSSKIWEEQRGIFNFVILQLFAIYLFIAALFINYYMQLKGLNFFHDYSIQYFVVVVALGLIYSAKFIIHGLLGLILKMNKLGTGFVANTVSVNNFLSLVILPFIVFMIYNENSLFTLILTQTIVAIFFISVFYRMLRITLLSQTFFSFPKVYLIIYLCASEVAPWLVIIKFINNYQI